MGIFRRRDSSDDLGTALLEGRDLLEQTAAAHRDAWQLGSATTWAVDLAAGTIIWQFEHHAATAPVQVIGSHNDERSQWTWAWAISSLPTHVRTDAETVREVGITYDHAALASPTVPVDTSGAADLMALAFRLTGATGFYRGPGADATYFTFGDVVLDRADGTSETFRISAT